MIVTPYAIRQHEQVHISDAYVASPPALFIDDEAGLRWTLGMDMRKGPRGEFEFDVQFNGCPTGEHASRIERRGGKVRIFTRTGWKHWNGRSFF